MSKPPMSPTDQLSSCILWGCAAILIVLFIGGVLFFAILMSGLIRFNNGTG